MARAIPEGLRTVTPAMTLDGCAEAIEFYKRAFGAIEESRAVDPSGKKVWHGQIRIGDSAIFMTPDEMKRAGEAAALEWNKGKK